jgi:hypothetical protein
LGARKLERKVAAMSWEMEVHSRGADDMGARVLFNASWVAWRAFSEPVSWISLAVF